MNQEESSVQAPVDTKWPARKFLIGLLLVVGGGTGAVSYNEFPKAELLGGVIVLFLGIFLLVKGYYRLRDIDEAGTPVMRAIAKNAVVSVLLAIGINLVVYGTAYLLLGNQTL